MSDADLVGSLRNQADAQLCGGEILKTAADRIEALAAEVERLRLYTSGDWASQRDNDALTIEMYGWKDRAESVERAMAEAVEIMRPLCKAVLPFTLNGDCTMVKAGTVKAARDFITAQEREKEK